MVHKPDARGRTPLLEVWQLSVSFGKHKAVDAASFTLAASEVVVILGANGAGKSTLLKALGGMVAPQAGGSVSMGGVGMTGMPAHRVVEAGVALVPEGRGIFGELSVRENLLLGAYAQRARAHAEQTLPQVFALFPRLQERQGQIARTMSGGEQQMVAIGRALMSQPKVLMLDEPSLGLSPLLSKEVFRAISRVAQSGVGVLLVEQNARLSLAIADRGYVMENARLSGGQPAARMLQDSALRQSYLGGQNPDNTRTPGAVIATKPKDASAAMSRLPRAEFTLSAEGDGRAAREVLAAIPIARLVAEAAERARVPVNPLPAATATALDTTPAGDALVAMCQSIETVAQRARSGAKQPTPIERTPGMAPSNARVQVWRRPGIEVYKRDDAGKMVKE
jgi:branched-chain amino acid transport system ATP-binding protein